MTQKGAERLRGELERLKSVERPRIIQAIAEARAHGDLKENAEYHAAREQQGFTEGRINELEAALSYAEVIDVSRLNAGSKIVFIVNTTEGRQAIADSFSIRREALQQRVTYSTTVSGAKALLHSLDWRDSEEVHSLQELHRELA